MKYLENILKTIFILGAAYFLYAIPTSDTNAGAVLIAFVPYLGICASMGLVLIFYRQPKRYLAHSKLIHGHGLQKLEGILLIVFSLVLLNWMVVKLFVNGVFYLS